MTRQILTYGSVCSGIEAVSVAWQHLPFRPVWFSEIEPFPSAVLAQRWPAVPNLGDMTQLAKRIRRDDIPAPDILVGGTPCQSFSIAGLRQGLGDQRGQLTLAFVELADAIDEKRRQRGEYPCIILWENVPGVLSSRDNAFGCFTGALAGESVSLQPPGTRWSDAGVVCGPARTVAFRLLDAQFFRLAQRRRRLFVIASARTDLNPAEILFESGGVRRHSPPCRETGKSAAGEAGAGTALCSHWDGAEFPHPTLSQAFNTGGIGQSGQELFSQRGAGIVMTSMGIDEEHNVGDELYGTLKAHGSGGFEGAVCTSVKGDITHTLMATANGASEDGTGRGTPIISTWRMLSFGEYSDDDTASTCKARDGRGATDLAVVSGRNDAEAYGIPGNWIGRSPDNGGNATTPMSNLAPCLTKTDRHGVVCAFKAGQGAKARSIGYSVEQSPTLTCAISGSSLAPTVLLQGAAFAQNTRDEVRMLGGDGQIAGAVCAVSGTKQTTHWCGVDMAVRRLIPLECERLQGFPPASQTCTVTLLPADAGTAPPAAVPVLMHLCVDAGLKVLKRYLPGERCLSVAFADKNDNDLPSVFAGDLARLITTLLSQAEVLLEDNTDTELTGEGCTLHRCADHYSAALPGTLHSAEPDDITQLAAGLKKTLNSVARKQTLRPPVAEDLPGLLSTISMAVMSLFPAQLRNRPAWAFTLELRRGYTQIPWRGKCAIDCPDGPRYQALGNSMAVPVVRWLGERISQACFPHS
ncbi:DNA cytosine methyltransferase [Klebsiella aerogenes]|uniref:DNA cytosine methyltransferase n=1 Tax=Klebsiella aerogenes TaxID=548 RepID=UPI001E44D69B|nr:DNA cytosine methyltransferase [Klebsiella aerogenes]